MFNNITLIKGRHHVVMNSDVPMFNSDGNLIVQDIQANKIFAVSMSEEIVHFFNLHEAYESPANDNHQHATELPINNNNNANIAGVTIPNKSTAASTAACWKNDDEVRCLIHIWKDHENKFRSMKSRDVWIQINQELQETNPKWIKKTPIQCENKWKDIKRKYMETKDYNSKSGNNPKTCKFYEELEDVLGEKPCVKPVAIASNIKKRKIISSDQCDSELSEDCDSPTQDSNSHPPKQKKMSRIQRELKDWSTLLLADAKAREEARERRHRETITESKVITDAYKEMMGKLIDKL